ncbi:hypothetical protein PTKIN_Ptkin17bG0053500 [Pterospermum kingtungense]
MEVIRQRRHINLRLPLLDISDRRLQFHLPLPPSAATAASVTIPATDLENFKSLAMEKPSGDVAILMEYMDAGTLDTLLRNHGTFSEPELAHITRQIVKGLSYLHAHKIIRRDLKPSNLLVNKNMEVKIADFGVSKIMSRTSDTCTSYVGTCTYMSPERFDPDAHEGTYNGYLGDIWSLGVTIMELFVGHFQFLPPGKKHDWATLMCAICFGDPPALPPDASDEFRSFIQCCLQKESSKRWTALQLLDHPFLLRHPTSER